MSFHSPGKCDRVFLFLRAGRYFHTLSVFCATLTALGDFCGFPCPIRSAPAIDDSSAQSHDRSQWGMIPVVGLAVQSQTETNCPECLGSTELAGAGGAAVWLLSGAPFGAKPTATKDSPPFVAACLGVYNSSHHPEYRGSFMVRARQAVITEPFKTAVREVEIPDPGAEPDPARRRVLGRSAPGPNWPSTPARTSGSRTRTCPTGSSRSAPATPRPGAC